MSDSEFTIRKFIFEGHADAVYLLIWCNSHIYKYAMSENQDKGTFSIKLKLPDSDEVKYSVIVDYGDMFDNLKGEQVWPFSKIGDKTDPIIERHIERQYQPELAISEPPDSNEHANVEEPTGAPEGTSPSTSADTSPGTSVSTSIGTSVSQEPSEMLVPGACPSGDLFHEDDDATSIGTSVSEEIDDIFGPAEDEDEDEDKPLAELKNDEPIVAEMEAVRIADEPDAPAPEEPTITEVDAVKVIAESDPLDAEEEPQITEIDVVRIIAESDPQDQEEKPTIAEIDAVEIETDADFNCREEEEEQLQEDISAEDEVEQYPDYLMDEHDDAMDEAWRTETNESGLVLGDADIMNIEREINITKTTDDKGDVQIESEVSRTVMMTQPVQDKYEEEMVSDDEYTSSSSEENSEMEAIQMTPEELKGLSVEYARRIALASQIAALDYKESTEKTLLGTVKGVGVTAIGTTMCPNTHKTFTAKIVDPISSENASLSVESRHGYLSKYYLSQGELYMQTEELVPGGHAFVSAVKLEDNHSLGTAVVSDETVTEQEINGVTLEHLLGPKNGRVSHSVKVRPDHTEVTEADVAESTNMEPLRSMDEEEAGGFFNDDSQDVQPTPSPLPPPKINMQDNENQGKKQKKSKRQRVKELLHVK